MVFRYAFKKTLPVMAGYIVLGMGFGILLRSKGYGVLWALLMSGLIYAGSMQYVLIDLIGAGASVLSTALMTVMVNARHLFYGISMIDRYRDTGKYKPYLIFALTDETYSLVCTEEVPEGMAPDRYYFLVSVLNQSYWVLGSVLGSLLSHLLRFDTTGIDFSMTALFLVVFVEQWRGTRDHTSALAGLFASLLCLVIFGPSRFIIPAMVVITVLLTVIGRLRGQVGKRAAESDTEE